MAGKLDKHDVLAELDDSEDEDHGNKVVWLFLRCHFGHSRALEWWEWVTRDEYEYLRAANPCIETGVKDHTGEEAEAEFSDLVQRVVYGERDQTVLETYVETKEYLERHLKKTLGSPEPREAQLRALLPLMRAATRARRHAAAAAARSDKAAEAVSEAEAALEQEVERTPAPSAKKPRVTA